MRGTHPAINPASSLTLNNMTKKHFIAAAKAIASVQDPKARSIAACVVATVARECNGNFDADRFATACKVARKDLFDSPAIIEKYGAPAAVSAPLAALRHHVTGAVERGEKEAIVGIDEPARPFLRVQMALGNAAFTEGGSSEVQTILTDAAQRLPFDVQHCSDRVQLIDSNGNKVGTLEILAED